MAIKMFTKDNLDLIINDINAALAPVAKRYGLRDLKLGRVSYSNAEFRTSINAKIADEDSEVAKNRMLTLSKSIGYLENIMGREMFAQNGDKYRVIDINTKKRKYPIVAENVSDPSKLMLFSTSIKFTGPEQPKRMIGNLTQFRLSSPRH